MSNITSNFKKPLVPSDILSQFHNLITNIPHLGVFFNILPRTRFVIDSNIIIKDLIWLARTRKNKSARTNLQEVIDSGIVIAYAPTELSEEVEKKLPEVAEECNMPVKCFYEEWQKYQKKYLLYAGGEANTPNGS